MKKTAKKLNNTVKSKVKPSPNSEDLKLKFQEATDKMDKALKQAKQRFKNTDVKKQKAVIAGLSAAVASLATAITMKKTQSKDKSKNK